MRVTTLFVVAAIAIFAGIAFAGCKDDSGPPSCKDAIGNFYDQNCQVSWGGTDGSKSAAINGCEDSANDVDDCDCKDEYDNLLECLDGASGCNDCETEFTKFSDCFAVC